MTVEMTPLIELSSPAELPPRRLSDDLRELLHEARGRSLTIGELEQILQGRGFALFILLMSLPFCFPVAVPGLSIPFGVVIMLLGLRIAMGQKPSLPAFILRREVKFSVLTKLVAFGLKLTTNMEKVARPRMHFLRRSPGMINLIGLGITSGGIQLLMPFPPVVPFTNMIPAVSIVLLTAGMIERDGAFVLAGYVVNVAAWIYFAFVFAAVGGGIRWMYHFFGG